MRTRKSTKLDGKTIFTKLCNSSSRGSQAEFTKEFNLLLTCDNLDAIFVTKNVKNLIDRIVVTSNNFVPHAELKIMLDRHWLNSSLLNPIFPILMEKNLFSLLLYSFKCLSKIPESIIVKVLNDVIEMSISELDAITWIEVPPNIPASTDSPFSGKKHAAVDLILQQEFNKQNLVPYLKNDLLPTSALKLFTYLLATLELELTDASKSKNLDWIGLLLDAYYLEFSNVECSELLKKLKEYVDSEIRFVIEVNVLQGIINELNSRPSRSTKASEKLYTFQQINFI